MDAVAGYWQPFARSCLSWPRVAQGGSDSNSALANLRQSLGGVHQCGMRRSEVLVFAGVARLEIATGDLRPALDHLRDCTRAQFDAGDFSSLTWPLALTSALLSRCDLPEPAALIAGFATTPSTLIVYPEFAIEVERLRRTIGNREFDHLGEQGKSTPGSEMVAYALHAIEEARARLRRGGGSSTITTIETCRASAACEAEFRDGDCSGQR